MSSSKGGTNAIPVSRPIACRPIVTAKKAAGGRSRRSVRDFNGFSRAAGASRGEAPSLHRTFVYREHGNIRIKDWTDGVIGGHFRF